MGHQSTECGMARGDPAALSAVDCEIASTCFSISHSPLPVFPMEAARQANVYSRGATLNEKTVMRASNPPDMSAAGCPAAPPVMIAQRAAGLEVGGDPGRA
jgi:hypothetical protein